MAYDSVCYARLVYKLKKQQHTYAQFAGDIAIWNGATLRKHTSKRMKNHVQNFLQSKLNRRIVYLTENASEIL